MLSAARESRVEKSPISDNVGGVKRFSSTLQHALREERHFALVEKVPYPARARIVILAGQETGSDPSISSIQAAIMITSSDSPVKGSGMPNQYLDVLPHTI